MTTKDFDFEKWLAKLKPGDEVLINKIIRKVIGVTTESVMANEYDPQHYCRRTGRELGRRKSEFGDSSIAPVTDYYLKKREQEKEDAAKKEKLDVIADEIIKLMIGKCNCRYDFKSDLKELPMEKLEKIKKALLPFGKS